MNTRSFIGLVLLISLFASTPQLAQEQTKKLTPGDIYKLKTVGNPEISPEGHWLLYTLTTTDSAKDNRNSDIWMTSWDGTNSVQLTNTPEGENNPKWSPDGKFISFTASRNGGKNQIFLLNRLGGEAIKLTEIKGELSDYDWSPDSKKILLTVKDPLDSTQKAGQPFVIDRYQFKQDVAGYRYDDRKSHLYLFDVNEKKVDTLTRGDQNETNAEWNPDGTRIVFVSNHTLDPDKNRNSDLFVMDAQPGANVTQLTTWTGSDDAPHWSPDGKSIAYLRSTSGENYFMYDQTILSVIPATGGTPKLLTKNLDRPVTGHQWAKDSRSLMAIVTDDAQRYLASFSVNDGSMTKVLGGNRVYNSLKLHPSGSWLTSMSDPETPYEYYALDQNVLRRITKIQEPFLTNLSLATVEKIVSKSKDGTSVTSLLYLPPNKGMEKLPVIFYIHGGPVSQDEFSFDLTRQMLAAKGYAVVAVNYRGSNGRGINYSKAIYADWGNKEVLDIQGAADHLIQSGRIDSSRMGIGGWSYGGILTDYTIAQDTRFKGAVSGAGSALQLSLYGVDQYILQLDNELGQPWKNNNFEKYLKMSYPFLHADKIKTPTLFMAGEKDFNVPAIGSEQMYQALRSIGTPTELIIYPGQYHGLTKPSYIKDRFERYGQWYDKYVMGVMPKS
ncbi:MAG: S9 family peptidase [Saprospiraceae bacterium]|nr:S9 family peptidase [Saprospiraceae bacterium]